MTKHSLRSVAVLLCASALATLSEAADAQASLGDVLDAGARRVSPAEFNEEIVGSIVEGPSPTGGDLEMIFAASGRVAGRGQSPTYPGSQQSRVAIEGDWKIDDGERVCVTMRMQLTFPTRCQYWFKLADVYFISDSDIDRRAKVLRRSVKKK